MSHSHGWLKTWGALAAALAAGLLAAALAALLAAPANAAGPYPGDTYPSPEQMGMFDHNEMGTFGVDPHQQIGPPTGPAQYFGLRQTNHWNSYLLRDDDGNFYLNTPNIRKVNDGDPWTAGAALGVKGVKGSGTLLPDSCSRAWTGPLLTETITPGGDLQRSIHDTNGDTQTWTFGPHNYHWVSTDTNYLDLSGTLATPGFQFLLPWKDPDGSTDQMYYAAQFYKVTGTYCGQPVHGYVYDEHIYTKSGYSQSWWVQQRVGYWDVYINSYSNGDEEFGHVQCGQFGEAYALIQDQDGNRVVDGPDVNVHLQDDGSYKYTFGNGLKQRFIPEFGAFGGVVDIGDKRKIEDSIAIQQRQHSQGADCGPQLPEPTPHWGK